MSASGPGGKRDAGRLGRATTHQLQDMYEVPTNIDGSFYMSTSPKAQCFIVWLFEAFREFTQHKLSQDLLLAAGGDRDWKLLGDRSARVGEAMSAD